MPILSTFEEAWFEGVATAPVSEVPARWPVAIAGHGYLTEPSMYRRTLIPVQRDSQDDSEEPGEQSLAQNGIWRRSQSDWSLGAGQRWLDETDSTRKRFYRSLGINVFDNQHEATLLPEATQRRSTTESNLRLLRAGDRLYVVDGPALLFSSTGGGAASETLGSWAFTAATGLPVSDILDVAFWGSHVIVLGGDNSIYGATVGTAAFTLLYNPAEVFTRIWVGLGRMFGAVGNLLYEITNLFAGGASTLLFTHPNTNFVYSTLSATPVGVYFGGNIGSSGEIRFTKVAAAGTGWDAPFVTAEFINETVNCLATAGKNMLIGTSQGFRYSPLDSQAPGLNFGPVVTEPGNVNEIVVDNVGAETFAWFTWSDMYDLGVSGVGRIRFARFAEPAVPAYSSDIYADNLSANVQSVASIRGRRYFAVAATGFYGASDNFVEEGWLDTGRIRYGILDTKVFADLQWRSLPLPSDAEITSTIEVSTGTTTDTGAQVNEATTESTPWNLGPLYGEWVEIRFILRRGGVVTQAMYIIGLSTGSATTPDVAAYAVTDLEVIVKVCPNSWVPGGFGATFMDQWVTAGNQRSWLVGLTNGGFPTLTYSTNGTNQFNLSSTVLPTVLPDEAKWFRYRLDVNNGAGGKTATFEESDDGVTFTLLDTVVDPGTVTLHNSTGTLAVGGRVLPWVGRVHYGQLSASIGGLAVANPNFEIQAAGAVSFTDAATRLWTLGADADILTVAGSDAEAPTLTSWVLRAIPSPATVVRFLVPVILRHKVQPHNGPLLMVNSEDELEFLNSLVQTQSIVKYQEGRRAYDVHVVNFEVQGTSWDKVAHNYETLTLVELHTLR